MEMLWPIVLRTVASAVALFLLAKLIGVRQIAQLTLYDYLSGITIGSLAAVAALDIEINIWVCLVSMTIFSLFCVGSAVITEKSIIARRILTGVPSLLIDNGKLIEKNMKKARYDVNDLLRECRCAGYFDISDIAFAMLECNGQISILPKSHKEPTTRGDLSLPHTPEPFLANVIIDGKIMKNNLAQCNKTVSWLMQELDKQKQQLTQVLLGTLDIDANLTIHPKGLSSSGAKIIT